MNTFISELQSLERGGNHPLTTRSIFKNPKVNKENTLRPRILNPSQSCSLFPYFWLI